MDEQILYFKYLLYTCDELCSKLASMVGEDDEEFSQTIRGEAGGIYRSCCEEVQNRLNKLRTAISVLSSEVDYIGL